MPESSERTSLEQAQEQGYVGSVADDPPNDAYTVSGQGEETVDAERQALRARRDAREDESGER